MKRLILIGNGFDLAHNLNTSYKHFLCDYWERTINSMINKRQNGAHGEYSNDQLTIKEQIELYFDIPDILKYIRENISLIRFKNDFLLKITEKQVLENWVDIEQEYFENLKKAKNNPDELKKLNADFKEIKELLIKYLNTIDIEKADINIKTKRKIGKSIYERFLEQDLTEEVLRFDFNENPDEILFLNFNYTYTESIYTGSKFKLVDQMNLKISIIHIHGTLENEPDNPLIFGYGDELDDEYKELEKSNNTACLDFIKSIAYLNSANYKNLLKFINSDFYQVFIMGHSCGISDRTLLNTIFEHKNCCSIKPFYFKPDRSSDNYSDLIKNISRNFNNKPNMRERVVNKTYTKTLT